MRKPIAPPRHPGVVLSNYLMGRPHLEVAASLRITTKQLKAIFDGEQTITPELSQRLDVALKTKSGLWLQLQEMWDAYYCPVPS